MAADPAGPGRAGPNGVIIPMEQAASAARRKAHADKLRHDNPHWPVRSPADAANALEMHGDCPWHCSTRVAAQIVSDDDYRYFRDRMSGRAERQSWTPHSDC